MPLVRANGLELCYEVDGDPDGVPLLLIHGHGAQLIAWHAELVEGLVECGFRTIRFDNRDAGRSTHLDGLVDPDVFAIAFGDRTTVPYLIDDLADDADALLGALGVAAAHVLGVSMGGMVAQSVAIRHPERTRSLTSIMSTPDPVNVGQPTDEELGHMLVEGATTRQGVIDQALASWRRTGSPALGIDEAWIVDVTGRAYDRSFDPRGTLRQFGAIVGSPDRRPGLANVAVPTLVVHGRIDPICTLGGGEATAAAVPGATLLVIDDMGHDLPKVVWPEVLDAICSVTGVTAARRSV
ncbi:MAG TPA: alpha/beta hydrolase [Acidimicrobiales bacterium]|nr:alpha/beta hydrolase [Acidimicrobiales bacterium]